MGTRTYDTQVVMRPLPLTSSGRRRRVVEHSDLQQSLVF